jgi:hypothetical protein
MDELRDHCLAGAAVGSLASILRFKPNKSGLLIAVFLGSYVEVLATFLFNGAVAYLFGPAACEMLLPLCGVEKTQNACIALGGAIALACPWIFKNLLPLLSLKLETFVRALNPKLILERLLRLWGDDKRGSK